MIETRCQCGNRIEVPTNPIHICRDCNHKLCEKCCDAKKAFLNYFNNYLTVAKFAEALDITEEQAKELIDRGRNIHENYVKGAT